MWKNHIIIFLDPYFSLFICLRITFSIHDSYVFVYLCLLVPIYLLSLMLTNLQSWVQDLKVGRSWHYERRLDIDQSDSALELIKSSYLHITIKLNNSENGKVT